MPEILDGKKILETNYQIQNHKGSAFFSHKEMPNVLRISQRVSRDSLAGLRMTEEGKEGKRREGKRRGEKRREKEERE